MTGYGRGEALTDGLRIAAEIRSVNHRFCEVSARLPRAFSAFEGDARKIVQDQVSRGKLSLVVTWGADGEDGAGEPGGTLTLDERAADRYMELLRRVQAKYGLSGEVDLRTFASLPNLFSWEEPGRSGEFYLGLLREVVEKATRELIKMKETEGEALKKDLAARVSLVRKRVARIRERAPERVRETHEKMKDRVRILIGEAEIPEDRLLMEIALLSDRLDCTEECVRLEAHCDHFLKYLDEESAPGRKLNFLLQEMNREINTIGSKSNDVAIVEQVVEVKEELERIREQVQNIE
ncbi:MAG TPA: YicC/YloC family endoribonuclease [Candidatus Limnocylindrales bacterium]|nr:YicC/YloC family endoribonuclease [Candidatus Limnocylindrales bacterium]